jgi:hypothetical protein
VRRLAAWPFACKRMRMTEVSTRARKQIRGCARIRSGRR